MLAFYSLVFSENLAMAAGFWVLWPRPRDTLYTILLSNVAAGTVLGPLLLLLYYGRFHPAAAARRLGDCPRADSTPAGTGTLRSLKCRAAQRVSSTSLRSAGGVSLTSQPWRVAEVAAPCPPPPAAAGADKPFHSASELLADSAGHVTRSAGSLPAARTGHVTAGERRNQSAAAILQRSAVSAEADSVVSVSAGPGRVSDIPQLDSVSEGDITLPAAPAPSDCGGGDSTAVNHSRMTSEASAPPADYENVISVSVHRGGPGVSAWRTYSDVGDSAHDYSVVTERAGRLDDSAITEEGPATARHTYENTDNVALMIAHLEDAEPEPGARDASLLVATIDAVERSAVSALFSSPPRRCRSTDDLAAPVSRRTLLNTSLDPGLLVAPTGDYVSPRSPPEAIYARPVSRGQRRRTSGTQPSGGTGHQRSHGEVSPAEVLKSRTGAAGQPQVTSPARLPLNKPSISSAAVSPRGAPLASQNTVPAARGPRRKLSVLRSRWEPAGRRYAVTPAAVQAGVSRRPSLQAAARALWTGRARRAGKENQPPTAPQ